MPADFEKSKILGQLSNASNSTLLVECADNRYIYKPVRGERPLWDFPDQTLFRRERAAFVFSALLGWDIVPHTQIAEGPLGIGSFQEWINGEVNTVDIFQPNSIPEMWLAITRGIDEQGNEVVLAHENSEQLARLAVFDTLINNADRKAGHIITDSNGKVWAIDHGVTFNEENKLRTVLWGWMNQSISSDLLETIQSTKNEIAKSELTELLSEAEVRQLYSRIDILLATKSFPEPDPNWPPVPWPIF